MRKTDPGKHKPNCLLSIREVPEVYQKAYALFCFRGVGGWVCGGVFWEPRFIVCGILPPQSETEPSPPTLKVQSLNQWTAREVPRAVIFPKGENLL